MSVLFEVALDRLALVLEVRGGDSEIHGLATGRRRRLRLVTLEHLEQTGHVVREIVELEPEIPLCLGPEDLVQLAHPAGFRIHFEELVPEQRLQLGWMLLGRHRVSSAP